MRRKLLLAGGLLALAVLTWFLVVPMFQYSAARKKFPLGMTLEDAQKVARKPFQVQSGYGGVTYGPKEGPATAVPPEDMKATEVLTQMVCDQDGAFLLFNWHNKLIEIRPTRSPVDFFVWKHTRRP